MIETSTNTVSQEVVDKIRKLLKLAESSKHEGEVELALSKSKELAIKYEIDLATINITEQKKPEEPIVKSDTHINLGARKSVTQRYVSWILQNHFNVKIIYSGSRFSGHQMVFIGRKTDIEIAQFVNLFLNNEFMNLWHQFRLNNSGIVTKDRLTYFSGLYSGLNDKLKATTKKVEDDTFSSLSQQGSNTVANVSQCYALAKITHKQRLEEKMEEFYPDLKSIKHYYNNGRYNHDVKKAGYSAGQKINISRAIGNTTQKCLV